MKREVLLEEFSRRPLASSPGERKKHQILTLYIYTLFLDHFKVFIVTVRCKVSKIYGAEKLLESNHFVWP